MIRLFLLILSPLHVLKEQLQDITQISFASQVLILCDLSDPDRNHDTLLTGRDYDSLFECGITDGSLLTLHSIGTYRNINNLAQKKKKQSTEEERSDIFSVSTTITPAQADHSYNGVIFDIESKSPFETHIISLSIGGMLGRMVSSSPSSSLLIMIILFFFSLSLSFMNNIENICER